MFLKLTKISTTKAFEPYPILINTNEIRWIKDYKSTNGTFGQISMMGKEFHEVKETLSEIENLLRLYGKICVFLETN